MITVLLQILLIRLLGLVKLCQIKQLSHLLKNL